jgi:hypothetical protein
MISQSYVPVGYQQVGSGALASAAPLAVPATANFCIISVDGSSSGVRWRDDGTLPTATTGILIDAGSAPFEYSGDLRAIQFITAAGGPILNVAYYKLAG